MMAKINPTIDSEYAKKKRRGQMYGPMPKIPKYPDFNPVRL